MHCQQYIEFHDPTIDIICRNSPALSGRYLVLIFQTTSDSHPLEVLSEQWQITIHSKEGSTTNFYFILSSEFNAYLNDKVILSTVTSD